MIVKESIHTHHTDQAARTWESFKSAYWSSINAKPAIDIAEAKKICEDYMSGDKARVEKAVDYMCKAACTVDALRLGESNSIFERQKTVTGSVLPMMPQTVATYTSLYDESELDMTWMQWYETDSLVGGFRGSLYDIKNLVVAHQLASNTADIPRSPYMASTWATIEPEHFGAGVQMDRDVMSKDPLSALNNVIIAIRYAMEVKLSQEAFVNTQAAIAAANTAGYLTTFVASNLPQTINNARVALALRNFNKGYALNGSTPMIMLAYEGHRAAIEAAFRLTNTVNFGTQLVEYPVNRVYTFNVAASLGISGNKAVMILPGRKNRYGIFKNLSIDNYLQQNMNAVNVDGRQNYNFIADETQFQILNLS